MFATIKKMFKSLTGVNSSTTETGSVPKADDPNMTTPVVIKAPKKPAPKKRAATKKKAPAKKKAKS